MSEQRRGKDSNLLELLLRSADRSRALREGMQNEEATRQGFAKGTLTSPFITFI